MRIKREHFIIIFFLAVYITRGQNRIEGLLRDDKGKPLPYCALALLNSKDSSQVKGNVTNEEGSYIFEKVPKGSFIIKSSAAGFEDGFSGLLLIDSSSKINVDPIVLKTKAVNLGEVSVTVIKKPIEFKNGNIIVNIEGSPLAIGNTVYDLLMRMPGVMVDGDNITLQGKSVRFMLNDRLQQVSGSQMVSLLRTMNASSVEKIELISNPPAKYDAAGSGGLINIVTKKIKITGFSGSIMNYFSQGFYANDFGQLSLNYKGKKISIFTDYNANYADLRAKNHWHREVQDAALLTTLDQYYLEKTQNRFVSFFGGIDWYIDKKQTLTLKADLRPGREKIIREATTTISDNSLGYENLAFGYEKPNSWFWQDYSLNYELLADTLGTKLTFNSSYSIYPDLHEASYRNRYLDSQLNDVANERVFKSSNTLDLGILTGRLDFEKNFKNKVRLETGAKASSQDMLSNFVFQNRDPVTMNYTLDTNLTNAFSYKEKILAAYIDMNKEVKKFNFRAGLRGEQTIVDAQSKTNSVSYERSYFNLFPVASIDYNHSQNHNYQLSYNRRINRADYNNFNPYKQFRSILTYVQGNPYLSPQYTNRVELRHTYKGKFSHAVSYSIMDHYFFSYNRENAQTKELIFYNGNLDHAQILSYNFFIQADITKWWMISVNGGIHYFKTSGAIEGQNYSTSTINTNGGMFTSLSLSKSTKLEINIWGNGPWLDGVTQFNARGSVNAAIRQNFLKDKLSISIGVQDIFYTMPVITKMHYIGQRSNSEHQWDSRRGTFSLTYNFGKIKVQKKNIKADNEEKNRVKRS